MDQYLQFDESALNSVKAAKPWMTDPRYFRTALISSAAAIKMLCHANSGVEKGLKAGSRPVEVMGLLLGRPSTGPDLHSLIITDAFPLPIEGAETRVLADDQEVINYMISMMENLEKTRKERFMGWYHSHPFDVDVHSHCHLSSTDVSTQLAWQRSEDNFGSPWLGIVIDPLRSLAKNRPEFGAFRAFPPEYSPPPNIVPDGSTVTDDSRIERWGNAWNRYHSLDIQYFSSVLGAEVLKTVSENYLWKTALSTTPILDKEYRERFPERVVATTEKLEKIDVRGVVSNTVTISSSNRDIQSARIGSNGVGDEIELMVDKAALAAAEIAIEQCVGHIGQSVKKKLFA